MYKPKVLFHPGDPLILDRTLDVAAAVMWAIYSLWGLFASILGISTIVNSVSFGYNFIWSGLIGTSALIACLTAISLFFDMGPRWTPLAKKKLELWAVRTLMLLIVVYPLLLIISAIFDADHNRGVSAVLALSYLVFPFYRTHVLKKRIKTLHRAQKEFTPDGTE